MGARVLVVDDEESIRQLIEINLRLEGYEVATAADGEDALRRLPLFMPDVITLDVMMPGLSGWDVAQRILGDPVTAHIRVILVSARAQAADRERGARVGVHGYVTKPFDPDELVAEVRRLSDEPAEPAPRSPDRESKITSVAPRTLEK